MMGRGALRLGIGAFMGRGYSFSGEIGFLLDRLSTRLALAAHRAPHIAD